MTLHPTLQRCFQTAWQTAAIALAAFASPVWAGGLDISVGVGGEVAPGVYGRVNIGNHPGYPAVVINQPVVIARPRHHVEPIYLHVPPGHARHWDRHCRQYGACGTPVYFVRSPEYRGFSPNVIPSRYYYEERRVVEHRGGYPEYRYEERREKRRDHDRYDYYDDDRRGKHGRKHDDDDHHKGRRHKDD